MALQTRLSKYSWLKLRNFDTVRYFFKSYKRCTLIPSSTVTANWYLVDAEIRASQGAHDRHWWTHSGYVLAVLLHNAGYSAREQYENLRFFATMIAPSLGAAPGSAEGRSGWPSFMTDDHQPIELSWDWGSSDKSPTVRYSIEPVGLKAGTTLDPYNINAASDLHSSLIKRLPGMRLEWFDHFKDFFASEPSTGDSSRDGHLSRVFYAFDLVQPNPIAKVYFFPALKAQNTGRSRFAEISQAIAAAPHCTAENLKALTIVHEYAADPCHAMLEFEMLAIDLIDPLDSRLKIYFRSRETSFDSVADVMTLGGRTRATAQGENGMGDLLRLWNAVLETDGSTASALASVNHRTSGILYSVEFKIGDSLPKTKVYIPVRHYSSSDDKIVQGLKGYFQSRRRDLQMPNYVRALSSLLYVLRLRKALIYDRTFLTRLAVRRKRCKDAADYRPTSPGRCIPTALLE